MSTQLTPEDAELHSKFRLNFSQASSLFIRKHIHYGPNNIAHGGFSGVLIRMSDKIQRLLTLQTQGDISTIQESVEDNLFDIMNYANIAVLLTNGDWPEKDNHNLKLLIENQINELTKLKENL